MKKVIFSMLALFSFSMANASWTRWQPTDFSSNGDGTYCVVCLNYGSVACMYSEGPSSSPTPGDNVTVKGVGDFTIISVEADPVHDDNLSGGHPSEAGPTSVQVEKL